MSPDLLRKLSDADLRAIAAGDLTRVSTPGLQLISGRKPEPEKPFDPTEGMSSTQKVLANIGGGMMDLATGARQLYTDMTGTAAEKAAMRAEVEEKRKRDEALAESTPGGKYVGKALQIGRVQWA
jgi:iron only hydrogenase large subunit-like protein